MKRRRAGASHHFPPLTRAAMSLETRYNTLFICTGNSARSILAEGMLNMLGKERFQAYSAGSRPKGEVHPLALATLERLHIPTTGYRSKSWDEFTMPGAPVFDFIFTVCDNAAGETCPFWPGKPVSAHWGVPDPAAAEGTEEQRLKAFRDTALMLRKRIELLLSLPIRQLDALSLQRELQDIGRQ
ncbi:arsenate reductase ArsC [Castellaniella ginsengisoli]|uniref:Arsenate reductase ArsC n=2 Tax=Castellaniella ginsengisoli TaxID=546114 RepID=A0ABN1KT67_9BURK